MLNTLISIVHSADMYGFCSETVQQDYYSGRSFYKYVTASAGSSLHAIK